MLVSVPPFAAGATPVKDVYGIGGIIQSTRTKGDWRFMRTLAVLTLLTSSVVADVVELKTGDRLDGRFKQATDAGVVIEVGGQSITMPLDKVRAIYLGAASKPVETVSLAGASLKALKGLQSVTTSGINLREYSPRVLDSKVIVDQYLSSPSDGNEKVRAAIGLAMRYHELALNVWPLNTTPIHGWNTQMHDMNTSIQRLLHNEKELSGCPAVVRSLAGDPLLTFLTLRAPELWVCASDKTAEAARLLGKQ